MRRLLWNFVSTEVLLGFACLLLLEATPVCAQIRTKELLTPRLIALRNELQAGNRAALENFWQEIPKHGTPLVEPIPGDDARLPRAL